MGMKAIVDSIEDLPEALREFYAEKDGKFQLSVDGMTSKDKLDEFRTNNVDLLKQLKDMKGKYGNIDMEKYQELMLAEQENKDKEMIDAGKIDELLEERTKRMREELQGTNDELTGNNQKLTARLEKLVIDNAARDAAIKAGVVPTAVNDVLSRVRGTFSLDGDDAMPKDSEGNVIYGSDGSTPLSIADWVTGLQKEAPHLFPASSGGGSQHNSGGQGSSKTMGRSEFDKTDQLGRTTFLKDGGKVVDE